MKTIEQIRIDFDNNVYKAEMEYPTKTYYKPNAVIDENKSVKWNKEEIARLNDELRQAKMEYQKQQGEAFSKVHEDVINALVDEYDLNKEQAVMIEKKVYNDYHSSMCDYFSNLSEFAEFAVELLKLK